MFNGLLFADATPVTIDTSAVTSAITGAVSQTTITTIIASILGASIGFALLWWGSRKIVRAAMSAITKGKIKF